MKSILQTFFLIFLSFHIVKTEGFELRRLPSTINSDFDEFPVGIINDKLIFIKKEKSVFIPFTTNLGTFQDFQKLQIPNEYFKFNGTFLTLHKFGNIKYFIFSGKLKHKKDIDIFCYKTDEKNKKTFQLPFPYNTTQFESHPQISKNGKILVFSAENTENFAGTDIFICSLDNDIFNKIEPIIVVNTLSNEITPFIDEQGNLYFARFDTTNYNIYKAEIISENLWAEPKRLPYPINTDKNELAPIVYGEKIYFASDRGKSGFDIYHANLCLPVFLEINLAESPNLFSSYDKITIYDTSGKAIHEKYLQTSSSLILPIEPNRTYRAQIFNECTREIYFDKIFTTICLDTSYLKYTLTLEISNNLTKEKNIPFFLTGYYKPITKYNLTQLKKLFDYNLIGYDDSTNYIEYPSKFYFDLSEKIEKTFKEIIEHISYFAKISNLGCISSDKKLKIEIIGYSDPRKLPPKARFFEESIKDLDLNFFLEKGTPLNNDILSKLRAYFTAKELIQELNKLYGVNFVRQNITWELKGGGTIFEEEDFLILRRVNIKIHFEQVNL